MIDLSALKEGANQVLYIAETEFKFMWFHNGNIELKTKSEQLIVVTPKHFDKVSTAPVKYIPISTL